MKVTDMWKTGQKPTISFELFPARSEKAAESLGRTIDTLAKLKPYFVSVTFGAGGSTREGSYRLVNTLKNEKNLEVVAYFAGYGLSPKNIIAVLDDYQAIGVENILVVRGDPPQEEEFKPQPDSFFHASDLVTFIRPKYDFCVGVAGYPEGHVNAPNKEKDIKFLKLKVDHGAEYIIANYFYDNQYFFDFLERCQQAGITVPVIPGVMPIYSIKMLETLAGLCGATITDTIRQSINGLPEGDKDALVAFGIEFANRQCEELLKAGVQGLHIYTMDRSKSTIAIVDHLRNMGF
ncbi:methylenetetrahydrofolate reductase [candidate division KSB1 bacterium]|nr:methylenetetrahydrofolate reductase [candidate division KSB1 bacterium]